MMKKNILAVALLSSALVIGTGVALAHGMRGATEVKADTPANVYVAFGADSAWKTWGASASDTKIYFFDEGDTSTAFPGDSVTATVINEVTYLKAAVPAGSTKMIINVWGGGSNQNKTEDLTIPTDGKNLFTVTSANNGALQTGAWSVLDTSGEVPEDESLHAFKLVGTGTAALGGWDKASSTLTMSAAGVSGYLKKIENVHLAVNDQFKVVDVSANAWYGNSFLATDATRAKFDIVSENFKVLTEGDYDVYIKDSANSHKVAILTHGEDLANVKEETPVDDGYYILGLGGDWAPRHGIADDKDGESGNLAEFRNVNLAVNDTFKVVNVVEGAGTDYYGYTIFQNAVSGDASDMTGKIVDDETNDHNFKVVTAGKYSIYLYNDEGTKISIVSEDVVAVDSFVATNITAYVDEAWKAQTAQQRVDTCTEKYNRAKTAYDALSDTQKALFTTNARYADAYAVYQRWAAVVGGGAVISVKGLNETSKTAIVIAAVSVGAIAAAAGFVFLRKRKNNA